METIKTIEDVRVFLEEENARRGLNGDVKLRGSWAGGDGAEARLTWRDPGEGFLKSMLVSHFPGTERWYLEVNAWRDENGVRCWQYETALDAPRPVTKEEISQKCDDLGGWTKDRLTRVDSVTVVPQALTPC